MPIWELPQTLLMQRMELGLVVGVVVPFFQQHKRQKYWSKKNKMQNINIKPQNNRQKKKEVKGVRWENKHGQIFFVPMLTFSNEHQERTEDSRQVRRTDRNCRILTGVALGIPHCPKLSKCHYSPFSSKRFPILPAWNLQKYIGSQTRIKLSPSNDHGKLPYTKRFSSNSESTSILWPKQLSHPTFFWE